MHKIMKARAGVEAGGYRGPEGGTIGGEEDSVLKNETGSSVGEDAQVKKSR